MAILDTPEKCVKLLLNVLKEKKYSRETLFARAVFGLDEYVMKTQWYKWHNLKEDPTDIPFLLKEATLKSLNGLEYYESTPLLLYGKSKSNGDLIYVIGRYIWNIPNKDFEWVNNGFIFDSEDLDEVHYWKHIDKFEESE